MKGGAHAGGRIHRVDYNVVAKWPKREADRLLDRMRIMRKQADGGALKGREYDAFNGELIELLDRNGGRYRNKNELLRETPLQIARKIDMVVSSGLNQMAKLGTGRDGTSFQWMQAGTDTTAEASGQTALLAQLASVDMDSTGARFDSGNDMKFAGFFDESTASGTYAEFANSTQSTGGIILNRSVLAPADYIVFTNGSDVMTFTSVILGTGT